MGTYVVVLAPEAATSSEPRILPALFPVRFLVFDGTVQREAEGLKKDQLL